MGAWSHESFGNDDACDFTYELEEAEDLSPVEAALDVVLESEDGEVDAGDACQAIAAAEVIARLQGRWGLRDTYSEDLDAWVEKVKLVPSAALVDRALRALDMIVAENSELAELWDESEDGDAWRAAVQDLKDRVGA